MLKSNPTSTTSVVGSTSDNRCRNRGQTTIIENVVCPLFFSCVCAVWVLQLAINASCESVVTYLTGER